MSRDYTILQTLNQIILEGGTPVNGYLIFARLEEFDETVQVEVRKLDADLVDSKIRDVLTRRRKLAELGEAQE